MSGNEDEPEPIDNAVLCMAWMWSDKTTVANAEKLVVKHFQHSYQDVYGALVLIWEKTVKVGRKPANHTKSDKFDLSAKELIAFILKLKEESDPKVNVIMTPTTLATVPIIESTWGEGDEASTAARLLNLEKQMNEMRTELAKGVQLMTSKSLATSAQAPGPNNLDTAPVEGQVLYSDVAARPGTGGTKSFQKRVPKKRENASGGEEPQAMGQEDNDDGFQLDKGRKKKQPRKVQYGTGNTTTGGAGGEAAPYEVWIGNTHPESTKEIITEVLVELGRRSKGDTGLNEDLEVLDCECLTKVRTDGSKPYTKQWRVKVPNRFREHMKKPEAFQVGWSNRRYFPARPKIPELHLARVERVEEVAQAAPGAL